MITLSRNQYWELDYLQLKDLTIKHLNKEIDFINDLDLHNGSYFVTALDMTKNGWDDPDQEITEDFINELLTSDEYKYERIDNAIWLLIMKDILPEGDYLVSICW